MPELPEVETVKRTLKNFVLNCKITNIIVRYPNIIDGQTEEFIHSLVGKTIQDIDRVGKYLIFLLEDTAFLSHLRMEGKYNLKQKGYVYSKHDHIIFELDNGQVLCYHDTRKFGRMQLVDRDDYHYQLPLSKLGPEPMDAQLQEVYPLIHKSSLPIKTLLLDQTIMAGIGNIYANEICFHMAMNPKTAGKALSKKRVQQLIDISSEVLLKAIDQGGTTIHSFDSNGINGLFQVSLMVHTKKVCPICQGEITKEMVHQRGTYYCKKCQKRRG